MKTLIIGSGKIGTAIVKMLNFNHWDVDLADINKESLDKFDFDVEKIHLDETKETTLLNTLKNYEIVLSACPYTANVQIAEACLETGTSYFDLTEDRYSTESIRKIAKQAKKGQVFVPQCGLAPGFIGILAHSLSQEFDELDEVKMRVGALPRFPNNKMLYNLTWSTEGLINEYSNPCESISNGRKTDTIPLEELETFFLDGVEYEAFNTSGGLGTLCETLEGKVKNMNYKTVRFPGHQHLMHFLLKDLRLGEKENRKIAIDIFNKSIATTPQDFVLAFSTVRGYKDGQFIEKSEVYNIPHQKLQDGDWTSIQVTTAAGACVMMHLHSQGYFPNGFVKQESVKLQDFLDNEFGTYYAQGRITNDFK